MFLLAWKQGHHTQQQQAAPARPCHPGGHSAGLCNLCFLWLALGAALVITFLTVLVSQFLDASLFVEVPRKIIPMHIGSSGRRFQVSGSSFALLVVSKNDRSLQEPVETHGDFTTGGKFSFPAFRNAMLLLLTSSEDLSVLGSEPSADVLQH